MNERESINFNVKVGLSECDVTARSVKEAIQRAREEFERTMPRQREKIWELPDEMFQVTKEEGKKG